MLTDRIENFFRYTQRSKSSLLVYDFIVNFQKHPLPTGHYALDGDNIFANVLEYDSVSEDSKAFEVHKRYIDFQFLVSGTEAAYLAQENSLTPASAYDEANDVQMLAGGNAESRFLLRPGHFIVFYPKEPHKPGCCLDAPMHMKKIVIKILTHAQSDSAVQA